MTRSRGPTPEVGAGPPGEGVDAPVVDVEENDHAAPLHEGRHPGAGAGHGAGGGGRC